MLNELECVREIGKLSAKEKESIAVLDLGTFSFITPEEMQTNWERLKKALNKNGVRI